jgi:hypothetical protein
MEDLITITVELSNADPSPRGDRWEVSAITRVFTDPLLRNSHLQSFIALEVCLSPFAQNDDLPKDFFVMLSDYLLEDRDIEARVAMVTDCCYFHSHLFESGGIERCKDRRTENGEMFAGFLKACFDAAAADDERSQ